MIVVGYDWSKWGKGLLIIGQGLGVRGQGCTKQNKQRQTEKQKQKSKNRNANRKANRKAKANEAKKKYVKCICIVHLYCAFEWCSWILFGYDCDSIVIACYMNDCWWV